MKIRWLLPAVLFAVLAALIAAISGGARLTKPPPTDASQLPVEGALPPLNAAAGWLNSRPLTSAGLSGKVVLVDFCFAIPRTQ